MLASIEIFIKIGSQNKYARKKKAKISESRSLVRYIRPYVLNKEITSEIISL